MENSRNKQFMFKLCPILSSLMKSYAFPLCPAWDVNHPFVQHILPLSHLVAVSVIRSTVLVPQCCVQVTLNLLTNVSKHKGSDAGNSELPKRSHSVSFQWKDDSSCLNKERKKSQAEVAKIYGKNESSIRRIVKKEKEIRASFALAPQL